MSEVIDKVNAQIEKINREKVVLKDLKEEVVVKLAIHNIGDVVKCNNYCHTGKDMVVRRRVFLDGWEGPHILYRGPVIKKDGKEGLNTGEHIQKIEKES